MMIRDQWVDVKGRMKRQRGCTHTTRKRRGEGERERENQEEKDQKRMEHQREHGGFSFNLINGGG